MDLLAQLRDLGTLPSALRTYAAETLGVVGIERLDTGEFNGQCVSLVARYIQTRFLPSAEATRRRDFGDGEFTSKTTAEQFSEYFTEYRRPTDTPALPAPGAVVSFSGDGPTARWGHVAIVVAAKSSAQGRMIRVLESNADNQGVNATVTLSDWLPVDNASIHGNVLGWTNPRAL